MSFLQDLQAERAHHSETVAQRGLQQQRQSQLEIDVQGVTQQATRSQTECTNLQTECAALQARLNTCVAELESEKHRRAKASESARVFAVSAEAAANSFKDELANARRAENISNEEAHSLRQNLAGESLSCAQLQEKMLVLEESMRERTCCMELVEAELLSQRELSIGLEEELAKAQVQLQTYKHRMEEKARESQTHGDQVIASKVVVERLTVEMESEREKLGAQIKELKCDRDCMAEQVSVLHKEILGLQNQVAESNEMISKRETVAITNVELLDSARLREQALASEVEDAKTAAASFKMQLKEVQDNVQVHLVNIHKMSERTSEAETNVKDANQRTVMLEAQTKTAIMEAIALQTLVNEEKKARKDTVHELSNIRAEWHAATLTNEKQERELQRLATVHDRNVAEMTGKDTTLAQKIHELSAVKDELGNKDVMLKAAAEEASRVRHSLETATQRLHAVEQEHAALEQQHFHLQHQRREESSASEVLVLTLRQELDRANKQLLKRDEGIAGRDHELESLHLSGQDLKSKLDEVVQAAHQNASLLEERQQAIQALECSLADFEKLSTEREAAVVERTHDLAALRSELMAKEDNHVQALVGMDAMLASKDQELAEARCTVEDKDEALMKAEENTRTVQTSLEVTRKNLETAENERQKALAYAAEKAIIMQAAVEASSKSLEDLQQMHVQTLGELASRECVVAKKGSELEVLQTDHEKLKVDYDSCAKQLRIYEESLTRKDKEIVQHDMTTDNLETKINEALQALREEAAALEAKEDEIKFLKNSVETFTKTVSGSKAALASQDQDLAALRSEIAVDAENHARVVSKKDAMLASKDQELAEVRCKLADTEESLAVEAEMALCRRSTCKASLEETTRHLSDFRTVAKEQIVVMMLSAEGFETQCDAAVIELRHLAAMLEAKEEAIRSLNSSLQDHVYTMSKISKDLSAQDQVLKSLKSEMAAKEVKHARAVSEKDAMLTSKDRHLAEARCTGEKKEVDLTRAEKEVLKLTTALEMSTKRLHNLQLDHEQALGKLAGREIAVAEKGLELETLLNNHAQTVLERDGIVAAKEATLNTIREEMAAKSQAFTKVCNEVSQSQTLLETTRAQRESLEKDCAQKSKELLGREKMMAEKVLELAVLHEAHVDLGLKLKSAQTSLHEKTAEVHSLQALLKKNVLENRATVDLNSETVSKLEVSMANLTAEFDGKCQEIQNLKARMDGMVEECTLQLHEMRLEHAAECDAKTSSLQDQVQARDLRGQSEIGAINDSHAMLLSDIGENHALQICALKKYSEQMLEALRASHTSSMEAELENYAQGMNIFNKRNAEKLDALVEHQADEVRVLTERYQQVWQELEGLRHQVHETEGLLNDSRQTVKRLSTDPIVVALTLELDFSEVSDHEEFGKQVVEDVVRATGVDAAMLSVAGLRAGSVIVDLEMVWDQSLGERTLQDLVAELDLLSKDASSTLRQVDLFIPLGMGWLRLVGSLKS